MFWLFQNMLFKFTQKELINNEDILLVKGNVCSYNNYKIKRKVSEDYEYNG